MITKHIVLRDENAVKVNAMVTKQNISANDIVNRIIEAVDLETLQVIVSFDIKGEVKQPTGSTTSVIRTIRTVPSTRFNV